jgi:two-component system, NtrC family, response regulator AtoC
MDMNMQTKFLRVLQERKIRRIGGKENVKIDVRVITATNKNLAREVQEGRFRSDLFYRLMGLQIELEPLRKRGNDIVLLARHFADVYCRENKIPKVRFSEETIKKLLSYNFPGNVRELKAIVELSIVLSGEQEILPEHLNLNTVAATNDFFAEDLTLDDYIGKIVSYQLEKNKNNLAATAKILGISRATIYRYIKNLNG